MSNERNKVSLPYEDVTIVFEERVFTLNKRRDFASFQGYERGRKGKVGKNDSISNRGVQDRAGSQKQNNATSEAGLNKPAFLLDSSAWQMIDNLDGYSEEQYNNFGWILKERIAKGDISLTINPEKQNPHLLEFRDVKKNKSFFTVNIETLQQLLNSHYATGRVTISKSGQIKEIIFINDYIGIDVDETGRSVKTNGFKVHYSKGRTHLVPYRKRLDEHETI